MPYERLIYLNGKRRRVSQIADNEHRRAEFLAQKPDEFLRFIPNPADWEVEAALKNDGLSIRYVENPDERLKEIAVNQDAYALLYIKDRTFELSKHAIAKSPELIKHIDNPTDEEIELVTKTSRKNIVGLNFEKV